MYIPRAGQLLTNRFSSHPLFAGSGSSAIGIFQRIRTYTIKEIMSKIVTMITNDKRTEETLKEGDEKFRALAESASFPIMIFQDDYWVYVNAAGRKAFGYSTSEFYKMHFWTFFGDNFNYDLVQKEKSRQNSKQPDCLYEFRIRCKNGLRRCMHMTVSSIVYRGAPAGIISMRDFTEHKRAQDLRKVIYAISNAVVVALDTKALILTIKKQLSLIIDTAHLAIICYDEASVYPLRPAMRIKMSLLLPGPMGTLTGYMIKQNRPILLSKDQISELVEAGEIDVDETNCESWLGVPLYNSDKIIGAFYAHSNDHTKAYTKEDLEMIVFISVHISNSIQRDQDKEDYRQALLKAEESESLKVAFLSNISHEIRTPMNAIIGFTKIIENEEISVHDREDFGSIISKSAIRLLSTVSDIIDVSKIHCNQIKINKDWFDLNSLLGELLVSFNNEETLKGKTNITIILENELEGQKSMIYTDGQRLRQALFNLLNNALIYTNEGHITFGYVLQNDMLCFFVQDSGKGIAEEKQALIFNSFRQEDESSTRSFDGVGLGLTISKGLIELLGGKISLVSEEGKGSTFSFSIPNENQNSKRLVSDNISNCTGSIRYKIPDQGINIK